MSNLLPLYIGFRYTRAKRSNHFISFIALISMFGIALGIAVLITVLSVMNGFDYEIHKRIFKMSNQVNITGKAGIITDWQNLANKVKTTKYVVAASPFVFAQGMLVNGGVAQGIMLTGIDSSQEKSVSEINQSMLIGKLDNLKSGSFGIVLGQELANNLNLSFGDKVTLLTPKASITPLGVMPRFKRFTVVGIFKIGEGFGLDTGMAFINLNDAQKLLQIGNAVTGLRLKVTDLYVAPRVAHELQKTLPQSYNITDWTEQYSSYFKAISMEKTMMFIILLFIIAVAAFNLVSSLVMTVTDKKSDIAILKTLGAGPKTIMLIFLVQGLTIGIIGTLFGVIGGILLAINAPTIVQFIEHTFHTQFISASIYFIDYLPSKLDLSNVLHVSLAALVMSFLATIYPAYRAAKVHPAEALRYE